MACCAQNRKQLRVVRLPQASTLGSGCACVLSRTCCRVPRLSFCFPAILRCSHSQTALAYVCSIVESHASTRLGPLVRQLEASCDELRKHVGATDLSKFVFFNNSNKSLRLYGFGCAIGTDAAAVRTPPCPVCFPLVST